MRKLWPFPISFTGVHLRFSFLRSFRQGWRISVLPCSHKNDVAHMLATQGYTHTHTHTLMRSRPPFTGFPTTRAGKCPTECFLSAFGHLAPSAPNMLFECFLALFDPRKCQKALKKHSFGHSEPSIQKALLWGTCQPGPLGTYWKCPRGTLRKGDF